MQLGVLEALTHEAPVVTGFRYHSFLSVIFYAKGLCILFINISELYAMQLPGPSLNADEKHCMFPKASYK